MTAALAVLALVSAGSQGPPPPPVIDNIVTAAEWQGATIEPLSGGGRVSALRRGEVLYLAVESRSSGFANVCIGGDRRVRLLHASAALGDITFERRVDAWHKLSEFEWALRDSPRAAAPSAAQEAAHLETRGWLAKASARPNTVREFAVRLVPGESHFAVTFVDTGDPNRVLAAPAALDDACADLKLAQGWVPEAAAFAPEGWLRVDLTRPSGQPASPRHHRALHHGPPVSVTLPS